MTYNREGFFDDGVYRECTNCHCTFMKTSKTVTLCPTCNSSRVKSSMTPEWKMLQRAKSRAGYKGHEFSITLEDIVIPAICPVLNIPLVVHSGRSGGYKDSPSLDRIDNTKGYTKDNIQVISQQANAMKLSATKEELLAFAQWVLEVYSD